ncbi:uncharacterized protein TNCT_152171, partial [Trichonephila clavata]
PAQLTIYAISVRDSTTASYHKCASFNGRFATTTLQLACAGGEVEGRYIHVEDNRHRIDYFSLCEIQVFVNRGSYECGEAERPAHAYSVRTETGAVNYRCVYGYRLEGPSTRICQQDGQWSNPQPICREIICPPVKEIPHGRLHYVSRKSDQLTLGTMANVSCDYGYQVSGSPLMCEEDGGWSKGNLSCLPINCGMPATRHESEQYVLLNGTNYGAVALLRCGDGETSLVCREDGTWSTPELDCEEHSGLSRLGLVEEDQGDVPTGIVIGMAVVVFVLLLTVVLVLLFKRKKVLRQNSTDSLPSKETSSTLAPNSPQPYENDAFYATIPVDAIGNSSENKKNFMSTILFPRKKKQSDTLSKKSDDTKDSGNSSVSNGCIYEEIGIKSERTTPEDTTAIPVNGEAVYAQVDLEEKRRSRLVKTLCEKFEPVDPPEWENTYRPEEAYDEVDLEPIKLRELPPIPDENGSGVTYASLSLPLDPPSLTRKNEIYEDSNGSNSVMKDNELYLTSGTLKNSVISNGGTYEEIGTKLDRRVSRSTEIGPAGEAEYSRTRQSTLVKKLCEIFEQGDLSKWKNIHKSKYFIDLPSIPSDTGAIYTSSLPLNPPTSVKENETYENLGHFSSVMKDNDLYLISGTLKV